METAFGPLVLHLDAYQVHNPPIMEALEGACCVHCGYEPLSSLFWISATH